MPQNMEIDTDLARDPNDKQEVGTVPKYDESVRAPRQRYVTNDETVDGLCWKANEAVYLQMRGPLRSTDRDAHVLMA